MTQGKIQRHHRSMKNVVKLENDCYPWELERAIGEFVGHYSYHPYHESLNNVTPADVYYGRDREILSRRGQTKRRTLQKRRIENGKRTVA